MYMVCNKIRLYFFQKPPRKIVFSVFCGFTETVVLVHDCCEPTDLRVTQVTSLLILRMYTVPHRKRDRGSAVVKVAGSIPDGVIEIFY